MFISYRFISNVLVPSLTYVSYCRESHELVNFENLMLFLDQLESSLRHYNVIYDRSEINTIVGLRKDSGKTIDQELYHLHKENIDGSPSSRINWDKNEETLNSWLVRIINEINSNPDVNRKFKAVQVIKEIFESIYQAFGYKYYNPGECNWARRIC